MDKLLKELDKMIRAELKDFRSCEDRDYKVGRLSGLEEARQLVLATYQEGGRSHVCGK